MAKIVGCPAKIPEVYCTGCGSVLIPTKCEFVRYNSDNREQIYYIELTCPNRTWRDWWSGHHDKRNRAVSV